MTDRDPQDPVNREPVPPGDPTPPATQTWDVQDTGQVVTPPPAGAQGAVTKADIGKRAIAAIIDGAVAGALGLVPIVGWIASVLYILLRDGFDFDFMDGRSVGKKLMNLRPVRLDGGTMDLATSARRNWTICLGSLASFLLIIPFLGWILYIPVLIAAIVLGIIELIKVFSDPEGRRLGDNMANTKVVEVAQ